MKRIKVVTKEGRSFLLSDKSQTIGEARSWMRAYNKHNPHDKIQSVNVVDKKPKTKVYKSPFDRMMGF